MSEAGGGERILFDCPVCDDGRKHSATIIKKIEKNDKSIVEVKCEDCGRQGTITKIKPIGIEIYNF
jgi:transcription elongation factor Elf1